MADKPELDDLPLRAMRLAEYAHRNRPQGPHYRKAPPGADRPPYFIHLAEVGWMLQDAGLDPETVAAGYLHDIIEDCEYTQLQLEREFGNRRVADLVGWVTEQKTDASTGEKRTWEMRNRDYIERLRNAPPEALALSCADKTANLIDMVRHTKNGHPVHTFTSKDHHTQVEKFEKLGTLYRGRVPPKLIRRFEEALRVFRQNSGIEKSNDSTPTSKSPPASSGSPKAPLSEQQIAEHKARADRIAQAAINNLNFNVLAEHEGREAAREFLRETYPDMTDEEIIKATAHIPEPSNVVQFRLPMSREEHLRRLRDILQYQAHKSREEKAAYLREISPSLSEDLIRDALADQP